MTAHTVTIELLHVPDCPLLERVRATLEACLRSTATPVRVERREGAYPSPTLLVDGMDVVTGAPPAPGVCCRLDLPSGEQILAALAAAAQRCTGGESAGCSIPYGAVSVTADILGQCPTKAASPGL